MHNLKDEQLCLMTILVISWAVYFFFFFYNLVFFGTNPEFLPFVKQIL